MICVDSVSIYPSNVTIRVGQWYHDAQLQICPTNASCKDVTWKSNKPHVASVNATTGYIYGKSEGTAVIYATACDGSGKVGYMNVTVTSGLICVSSVSLDRSNLTLRKYDTYTLKATVCPENATNKQVNWFSNNSSVATVINGVVTAKSKGAARITAEAVDGSGEKASCCVNVTEDVLVSSIAVSPSAKTMTVGKSAYLQATVCPTNATNKCVVWSSSKPNVATVNHTSGLVVAQGEGTAKIRATAEDGSEQYGECTLTVNAPIPVESVEVCPSEHVMYIGQTKALYATVCPYNATNKTVTWCSSNTSVATVGSYTGIVKANRVGSVTITASTEDGDFSASVEITVKHDSITIKKDGTYTKVVFNTSGKAWKCIDDDIIFDYENLNRAALTNRANCNYFIIYDEFDENERDTSDIKRYTDDELRILYAIDPHGVAYYVNRYAMDQLDSLSDSIEYKNHIFEVLFDRKPKYFGRTVFNEWLEVDEPENNDYSKVISESETLFGFHPLRDLSTWLSIIDTIISVISLVLNIPKINGLKYIKKIRNVYQVSTWIMYSGYSFVKNSFGSFILQEAAQEALEDVNIKWAFEWVSLYDSVLGLIDSICVSNFYRDLTKYCVNNSNFDIYIELSNGTVCKMDDINDAINLI